MIVHRLSAPVFIDDLSGRGSFLHGGRWNRKGVYVLYTADSFALAAWEYYVHMPTAVTLLKNSLIRIAIEIPDIPYERGVIMPSGDEEDLFLQTDKWIAGGRYLCMQVPSFVVPDHFNYLLNPNHPAMADVKIIEREPFSFDDRSFGKTLIP